LKIAVLSSASAGGAGIAAYRIFEALSTHHDHSVDFFDMSILGHASDEVSPHESVTNRKITNTHFTADYASDIRTWLIDMLAEYDYLNIQWSSYLLSIVEILELARLGKKILFTLHDFYYITGGCHYPAGCTGYKNNCIGCPQVNERIYTHHDVIHALKLKREIFSYSNVHLSAPSNYIVNSAIKSGIIPKERGHACRNAYQPTDTHNAASSDVLSLLLIADSFLEERKGIELAINSIKEFCRINQTNSQDFRLHVVGTCEKDIPALLADSKLSLMLHGHVSEHSKLVAIFQQCQYMLTCSYEDNWPNILVEAGAYGCIPIVGKGHGCEEFCHEFNTGFIASQYSSEAFATCLSSAANATVKEISAMAESLRQSVRNIHSYTRVSGHYLSIFPEILADENARFKYLNKARGEESTCLVSENFLGQTIRILLVRNNTRNHGFSSIKLNIQDTPFAITEASSDDDLIVTYDDQTIQQIHLEPGKDFKLPTCEESRCIRTIFALASSTFGLREFRVKFE